jgi:tetratricopeptide (TPR) repeat protein
MIGMIRAHVASLAPVNPLLIRCRRRILDSICHCGLVLLALVSFQGALLASNQPKNTREAPLPIDTAANEMPSDWETLLQSAEAAEANNDDIQALNLYNQLLVLRPHNASIWNRHGLAAMRLQDFSTAVRSLSEAVRDYPINGSYYESLAWALLARGDYSGASERSRTAILMYQRENNFSLYPFFIRFIAEHAQDRSDQAALSLRYAKRNLRDRSWPLPLLEYLSENLSQNQLLANVSNLREETEAHLIIGLREYFIGDSERGRQHLTWAAGVGDPRASGQAVAHAFRFNGLNQKVGGVF